MVAIDAETATLLVPNSDPVIPLPSTRNPLPEICNEPVITALPLNGNPAPVLEIPTKLPLNEPEYIPSPVVEPPDNTSTLSAVMECDDVIAQLDVPNNDPVIPLVTSKEPEIIPPLPDTNKEPVITALPLNGNPVPAAFSAYDAVVADEAVP